MSVFTARCGRALLGASALSAGLLANGLVAPHHAAAYGFCRSDPIVALNNGVVLDLSASIADDASNVQQVAYTLHVPAGVSVARWISTDGTVGYKEAFTVAPPLPGTVGTYSATTAVTMVAKGSVVSVTATTEGGYASTLGITPDMVGFTSWPTSTASTTTKAPPPPPGGTTSASLSPTVTAQLAAWAAAAPWSTTASNAGLSGGPKSAPAAAVQL